MTSTKLNTFRTTFFYTLNTTKLDSISVDSSLIELSGLKWKVQFRKKTNESDANKHALGIHLIVIFGKDEMKWTCDAQAGFKLLNGQDGKSMVKDLPKNMFDSINSVHGIDDFINWDEFLQHYVHGNLAEFEIEISTSPLKRTATRDMNQHSTAFHVVIESVSKLNSVFSSEVVLHGVRWKVNVTKSDEFLAVYLYGDAKDMDPNWSLNVDCTFEFSSFDRKVDSLTTELNQIYNPSTPAWGRHQFLKWSDFIDENKKYVYKDTANLFVELKVSVPKPLWKIQRSLKATNPTLDCCICLDPFPSGQIFTIKCGHLFCKPCIDKSMTQRKVCPTCQTATSVNQLHPIFFA